MMQNGSQAAYRLEFMLKKTTAMLLVPAALIGIFTVSALCLPYIILQSANPQAPPAVSLSQDIISGNYLVSPGKS